MNSRKKFLCIGLVLIITVIIIVWPYWVIVGFVPSSNLYWKVEVGQEFTYRFEFYEPTWESVDNGSMVCVNITNLPDIPLFINSETFVSSVIKQIKVQYIYDEGVNVSENIALFFERAISWWIMPCGNWILLDMLYPSLDSVSFDNYIISTHLSDMTNDSFIIGSHTGNFDASSGVRTHVSLNNGMPTKILYWSYSIPWWRSNSTTTTIAYGIDNVYTESFSLTLETT